MIRTAALCLLLAQPLAAETLPHVYDVTGVAADDTLNIRSAPDASAQIIGTLAAHATRIEVVETSPNGDWSMIGTGEGNGWVAQRYLRALPTTAGLPTLISCSGTEPFWGLGISGNDAMFSQLGLNDRPMTLTHTGNTTSEYFAAFESGEIINVRRAFCSDGMSDRIFGLKISMFGPTNGAYVGCCTLQVQN